MVYEERNLWSSLIVSVITIAVYTVIVLAQANGGPIADVDWVPIMLWTIGVSIVSGDWSQFGIYVLGQMLGTTLGSVLVWLHYLQHWGRSPDAGAKRACFCTSPAIRHIPSNLLSEIIGTFVLVFVAAAISSDNLSPNGMAPGFGPFLVGLLVWGIGLSLGGPTGYAINPARDLGPRIAHALLPIAGKGSSGWDYAAVPIVGPIVGAVLAGLAVGLTGI